MKTKNIFLGWPKSVFGPNIVFLFENIENVGKVLSGNKNYIFGMAKKCFGAENSFFV
jgi:hypothetical protein